MPARRHQAGWGGGGGSLTYSNRQKLPSATWHRKLCRAWAVRSALTGSITLRASSQTPEAHQKAPTLQPCCCCCGEKRHDCVVSSTPLHQGDSLLTLRCPCSCLRSLTCDIYDFHAGAACLLRGDQNGTDDVVAAADRPPADQRNSSLTMRVLPLLLPIFGNLEGAAFTTSTREPGA